jgi:hypothetical protein
MSSELDTNIQRLLAKDRQAVRRKQNEDGM